MWASVSSFRHGVSLLALLLLTAAPDVGTLVVEPGNGSCLSASALREELRARLGREGLVENAPRTFIVRETAQTPHTASLSIRQDGGPDSVRSFTSTDCREVLESVALAIAVSLDPAVLLVLPKRAPEKKKEPPTSPVPPPVDPVLLGVGLLGGLSLGLAPGPTATVGVVASLRWRSLELRADGRFELPREVTAVDNTVSAFSVIGSLAPGWQHRFFRIGLPISVGALFFTSTQGQESFRGSRVVVLVGPEVAVKWSPVAWLTVEPFVRAQFVPTRVSVLSGVQTLWVTWPVSVLVGLQLGVGASEAARE